MKPIDIIRLAIVAIAIFLGYSCILNLVDFVTFLPDLLSGDKPDDRGILSMLLRIAAFFTASYLLIRNNRKISNFIEEQK